VFQVTTVNYFGGGESFHQTATYLTAEAEGKKKFLFCSNTLSVWGDGVIFFFLQSSELEDILMGEDFVILNREWELGLWHEILTLQPKDEKYTS
jgi:hypothetical protein